MGWNNDNETKQHFTMFKQTKMKTSQQVKYDHQENFYSTEVLGFWRLTISNK